MTEKVYILAKHLERYSDREASAPKRRRYFHMGATICDAALQAGLNYRNVVEPRIANLLRAWPTASTTSAFGRKADLFGLSRVLDWRDPVKLSRIIDVTDFFMQAGIETENQLSTFLSDQHRADSLRAVKGIGPKTLDYLKILAGLPVIAIDRHVRAVMAEAGITCLDYDEARALMLAAAERLAMDPAVLDNRIWATASRRAPADRL
jgi:hypothetical protein